MSLPNNYNIRLTALAYQYILINRGAIGGKTGKTSVLPGFWKIERGGGSGSGGALPCIGVLSSLGVRTVPVVPLIKVSNFTDSFYG